MKKPRSSAGKDAKKFYKPSESRRSFLRVDFEPGSKVGVTDEASVRHYDAMDLSVYGLSFLVPREDAHRYYLGRERVPVGFAVGGRRIEVNGKVAYLQPGLTAGLTKVAVEFMQLEVDDVWHLSRYLAERSGVGIPGELGIGALELGDSPRKPRRKPKPAAKRKRKPAKKTAPKKKKAAKKPSSRRKSRRR